MTQGKLTRYLEGSFREKRLTILPIMFIVITYSSPIFKYMHFLSGSELFQWLILLLKKRVKILIWKLK